MTACEHSAMITGIACMLAKDKSVEELKLLAAMFYQLGRTLETMAIYNEVCIIEEEEDSDTKEKTTKSKPKKSKTAKEEANKETSDEMVAEGETTEEEMLDEETSEESSSEDIDIIDDITNPRSIGLSSIGLPLGL